MEVLDEDDMEWYQSALDSAYASERAAAATLGAEVPPQRSAYPLASQTLAKVGRCMAIVDKFLSQVCQTC